METEFRQLLEDSNVGRVSSAKPNAPVGNIPPCTKDEETVMMVLRMWANGSERVPLSYERCLRAITIFQSLNDFVGTLKKGGT